MSKLKALMFKLKALMFKPKYKLLYLRYPLKSAGDCELKFFPQITQIDAEF